VLTKTNLTSNRATASGGGIDAASSLAGYTLKLVKARVMRNRAVVSGAARWPRLAARAREGAPPHPHVARPPSTPPCPPDTPLPRPLPLGPRPTAAASAWST
jgi:hypothetical protein